MSNSLQMPAEGFQSLAAAQPATGSGERLYGPVIAPNVPATGDAEANSGFRSLARMLQTVRPEKLDAARRRAADLDRCELLDKFGKAFARANPLAAFVLADELTARGIPPAFRHLDLSSTSYSLDQRFALLLADLRWLRRQHPEHVRLVRYQRYKDVLAPLDGKQIQAAEYVFWEGRRPPWKITGSLSLDQRQQWDCIWLRSTPLKKRSAETQAMREQVFAALRDDLQAVRRTATFDDGDAQATLMRRFHLWLCSRMTDGSPSETAMRYWQLTGQEISRQAAAKQLEKITQTLIEKQVTGRHKKRVRIV